MFLSIDLAASVATDVAVGAAVAAASPPPPHCPHFSPLLHLLNFLHTNLIPWLECNLETLPKM